MEQTWTPGNGWGCCDLHSIGKHYSCSMCLELSLRRCLLFDPLQLGISPLLFYEDHIPKREQFPKPPPQHHEGHQIPPHPRLCVLHKEGSGFGFNLGCVQNKPGTYIGQVLVLVIILLLDLLNVLNVHLNFSKWNRVLK